MSRRELPGGALKGSDRCRAHIERPLLVVGLSLVALAAYAPSLRAHGVATAGVRFAVPPAIVFPHAPAFLQLPSTGGTDPLPEPLRDEPLSPGLRERLANRGIVPGGSLRMDLTSPGVAARPAFRGLGALSITIDLDRSIGWKGARVFMQYHGKAGSVAPVIGSGMQGVSNIDAHDFHAVGELWYELEYQDAIRMKVGRVDAAAEFAAPRHAGEFLNPSMGITPTVLGAPTYPAPAASVNLFLAPSPSLYMSGGLFDAGSTGGNAGGFYIGEVGAQWSHGGGGRIALGGWRNGGLFATGNGSTRNGAAGFFLVLDQALFGWPGGHGLEEPPVGISLQYGRAAPTANGITEHLGIAVAVNDVPFGLDDVAGLGTTVAEAAGEPRTREQVVEAFYGLRLTPWARIVADMQWAATPAVGSTAAATLRFTVDL